MKPPLQRSIRGRSRMGKLVTWRVGDCVRLRQKTGKYETDQIRGCYRDGTLPVCILTRHWWMPTEKMTRIKCSKRSR
jgi:hypothetical protein